MERDWRCSQCGILLARLDETGLKIRRSEFQATLIGEFVASIVCYRPRCRTLNVRRVRAGDDMKAATR